MLGGGWFMTPADMLRVLDGLTGGGLLPVSQRRLMDGNCLGWDCSVGGHSNRPAHRHQPPLTGTL